MLCLWVSWKVICSVRIERQRKGDTNGRTMVHSIPNGINVLYGICSNFPFVALWGWDIFFFFFLKNINICWVLTIYQIKLYVLYILPHLILKTNLPGWYPHDPVSWVNQEAEGNFPAITCMVCVIDSTGILLLVPRSHAVPTLEWSPFS